MADLHGIYKIKISLFATEFIRPNYFDKPHTLNPKKMECGMG